MPPKKIKFKVVEKLPAKEKPAKEKMKPTLEEYLKTAKLTRPEREAMFRQLAKEHVPTRDEERSASRFYADPKKEKAARIKIHTENYIKKYGKPKKKIKFKVVKKLEPKKEPPKKEEPKKEAPKPKPKLKVKKQAQKSKPPPPEEVVELATQPPPEPKPAATPTSAPAGDKEASKAFEKYYDIFTGGINYDKAVIKYGPTGGRFKTPSVLIQEVAKSIMPRRRKAPTLGLKSWLQVYGYGATEEQIDKVKEHNRIIGKNSYKIMRRGLKTQALREAFDKALIRNIEFRMTEKSRASQIRRAKAMKKDKMEWYNYYTGVGDRHGNTRLGGTYEYQEGKDERADEYVNEAEKLFNYFKKEYNI